MNIAKIKAIMVGGVCTLLAIFGGKDLVAKSNWSEAPARAVSVVTKCQMESTERHILSRTVSRALIPCSEVEAFKTLYSEKKWTVTRKYSGTLRVGTTPQAVVTTMALNASRDHEPAPNDTLTVIQNPTNLKEVQLAGQTGFRAAFIIGCATLGGLALILAFRRRSIIAAVSSITSSTTAEKGDLNAAEALAKRRTAGQQPVPSDIRPSTPAENDARYGNTRKTFGR